MSFATNAPALPSGAVMALYQLQAAMALTVLKRIELLDKRQGVVKPVSEDDIKALRNFRGFIEFAIEGANRPEVAKASEVYVTAESLLSLLGKDFKSFASQTYEVLKKLEIDPSLISLSEGERLFIREDLQDFLQYLNRCSDLVEDEDY